MKRFLCLLLVSGLMLLPACGEQEQDTVMEGQLAMESEDDEEHVVAVKNGSPADYPDCTYGDAFANYFGSPTWNYFQSKKGKDIVQFTGRCTYEEEEVLAKLQFILDMDAGTFETGGLSFNGKEQENSVIKDLMDKVFKEYQSASAAEAEKTEKKEENSAPAPTVTYTGNEACLQSGIFHQDGYEESWYNSDSGLYIISYLTENHACFVVTSENYIIGASEVYYVDITDAKLESNGKLTVDVSLSTAENNPKPLGDARFEMIYTKSSITVTASENNAVSDIVSGVYEHHGFTEN